ncbi:glutamyl-tRNA(Gln) amidotransferase subunit A [Colletotrichum paranaense]|uniref:Glutamyl-tRNA(Gln) amidotransferase subunit A n=1 Tax=Colletotrichum paranaense TaxID=1914294 RepID=A0ABQ9S311_9PEZI|nr:glutamyl-tRNA(Gln) amidotransferase subunit A [Colletotrichum paranaense]KAK1522871.1 glutamyl-tRNA(Gln) amidotransferase subunit A [Colletotrichum paranaense]
MRLTVPPSIVPAWHQSGSLLVLAYFVSPAISQLVASTSLVTPLFPLLQNENTTELFPMPVCAGTFKLEEATIDQMQKAMEDGILTSQQLVMCYMQRTFQTQEYISSVMQLNPDVMTIAAKRDEQRKAGQVLGPLHGIPFTVKDNIATQDSMETTAGSYALLGSIVPRDAFVVARLRAAGAVLFGKSTMSEWADMRSTGYSEGYSPRGGQPRSPYNLVFNPMGSSSGSAVGVAANAIAFSLGTETDGSVISPAHKNGVVGIKPTVGLTSRDGVIPECEHQDTVGTFGRTVRDAVYALDAIYGVDPRDSYTEAQSGKTPPPGGYAQYLTNKTSLHNATFGIPWNSFWAIANEETKAQLGSLITLIQKNGGTIVNFTEITDHENVVNKAGWDWNWQGKIGHPEKSEYTIVLIDFYNNIKKYLSELQNTKMRSLEDIIKFNYENDGIEGGYPFDGSYTMSGRYKVFHGLPAFRSGQDGFLMSNATQGIRNDTYWKALNYMQTTTRVGIDGALNHTGNPLSGLLVPISVAQTYQIAAQAGYPMITIPAGVYSDTGMPFGLGIMQTEFGEEELVRWASAIEDLQLTSETPLKRTRPKWLRHLEKPIPISREPKGN